MAIIPLLSHLYFFAFVFYSFLTTNYVEHNDKQIIKKNHNVYNYNNNVNCKIELIKKNKSIIIGTPNKITFNEYKICTYT